MKGDAFTTRRVTSIEFSLSAARHGWLDFLLILGDEVFRLCASNVLNDPVSEITDWIDFLVEPRSGFRRLCVWLEPEGYAFDLQAMQSPEFMVSVWWDEAFVPPMACHTMESRHRFLVNGDVLCRALVSGLRAWVDGAGSDIRAGWGSPDIYERRLELLGFGREH